LSNEEPRASITDKELAALRAENEELRHQFAARSTKGPLWRRILAGALAVLAIIAMVGAVQAVGVKTTLQDEERFVATLQSLPQNEAVASVLSIRVAEGVVEAAGVEVFVSDALPDELGFLAVPMTAAIEDLIAGLANEVIQSDAVTSSWTATLRVTHKAVSAVLTGNDGALVAAEGKVAIDLDEIGAVVIDRVEATGLDLPDFDVSLGQVVLYEDEDLAAAQAVAQGIDTMGWLLPVMALILIAGAIWAAPNRRRMTVFLGFGTALALLVSLASLRISRNAILNGIEDELQRGAAGAVWDTVLTRLIQSSWGLLLLALIVGLIARLTGPSEHAQRFRTWTSRTLDGWRRPAEVHPSGLTAFIAEWKRTIQVLVVVLGLLFVLFGPTPSGLLVIITTAVLLAIVILIEVLAGPERSPAEDLASADR